MGIRVGQICYSTSQGLGRMAKQFFDAGITQHALLVRHGSRPSNIDWYPRGTPEVQGRRWNPSVVDQFLRKVDVVLGYETFFSWDIVAQARRRGVKTALITMYEWTPANFTHKPDLLIAPSLLDRDYYPDAVFLEVPVETKYFRLRTHARRFLHNAGNVGCDEHKGTRQVLQAVPYVRSPDFRLTVRAQDARALKSIAADCPAAANDPRVTLEYGERPYETLWDDHDVLIAPEKRNGLSLPLSEGWAAGMAVMTTDRYPMNTWLPQELLIPVERYTRTRCSAGCFEHDLAVVAPETIAAKIDEWVGRDITPFSAAGERWAAEHSFPAMKPKYQEIFESLTQ